MLLRSTYLRRKPAIFKTMTGLTVALFEDLVWDIRPALAQTRYAAQDRPGRQRAIGGGRHCRLPEREEILLTVIWLRHYFTQEALGYFFGVSDSTAKRAIERVLPVLEQRGRDTMRQPPPSWRQRYGVAEALRAYPALADLDAEEFRDGFFGHAERRAVIGWHQHDHRRTGVLRAAAARGGDLGAEVARCDDDGDTPRHMVDDRRGQCLAFVVIQ